MYGQPVYGQPVYNQPVTFGQPAYGQPMYGQPAFGQPGFIPPPLPPSQTGPTIITLGGGNDNGTPCQYCGTNTSQILRRKVGCVAIAWGVCLLFSTGFLCCLPCCLDNCKDTELICVTCQQIKNTIPANCC